MLSLTAFAQETTKTEAWFEEHLQEMHCKITSEINNNITEYEYYIKNDKFSLKNVPVAELNINLDASYNGESCFICPSAFPFIHFTIPVEADVISPLGDLSLLIEEGLDSIYYIGSYTKTAGSKEYYVEAFSDTENYDEYSTVSEFWFDGENLKFVLNSADPDYRIDIISTQVDDSVFEPSLFSINLTPFFTLIAKIFSFNFDINIY